MKRFVLMIITVLICGELLISCRSNIEKDDVKNELNIEKLDIERGCYYYGTFTVTYFDAPPFGTDAVITFPILLDLKDGIYKCITGAGSGGYSVKNDKIIFSADSGLWGTNFDQYLILNGEYDYILDGKELKITADRNGVGRYEYLLIKEESLNTLIDEGIYSGTFTTTYMATEELANDGFIKKPLTVIREITLLLENGKFICRDNTKKSTVSTANGGGTYSIYSINDEKIILFIDYCARTANQSWDWILIGEYNFAFNGQKLKLSKGNDNSHYEYNLERK